MLPASAQELINPNCDTSTEVSLAEMASKASIIVEGKVTGQRGFWNTAHTSIYTAKTITVYKVFKGTITGNQVEIVTLGGRVGDQMLLVKDGDNLPVQGAGLFFGVPTTQGTLGSALPASQVLDIYGNGQGQFSYRGDGDNYNTAVTTCRQYRDIRNTLYAPIQQAVGRPYQELAPFSIDTYDVYSELRETPPNAPQKKSSSTSESPQSPGQTEALIQPTAVPVISSVFAVQPNNSLLLNGEVTGGTFNRIVIRGTGLTAASGVKPTVFFANADYLQNPLLQQRLPAPAEFILAWSATEITLYVPSNVDRAVGSTTYGGIAGTGFLTVDNTNGRSANSPQPLTIIRSETNVDFGTTAANAQYRQVRYTGPSAQRGYEFRYDESFFNNPFAVRGAQYAMRRWRQTTTLNVGDDIVDDYVTGYSDGVCGVTFLAPSGNGPNFMRTLLEVNLCTDNSVNGNFGYIRSADIQINPNRAWHYDTLAAVPANKYDFHSAILHEYGHVAGLEHVNNSTKVMHPVTPAAGTFRRKLRVEPELNGVASTFTRSQRSYSCLASQPLYPNLMRALTVPVEQTGGQVMVSDTVAYYDPCPNTTTGLAFTASGTPTYTWGSKSRFNGAYPHTSRVTTTAPPTDRVFVYGSQYGLGDAAIVRLQNWDNVWCPPGGGSSSFRTTAYPNPSTGDFSVEYQPAAGASTTNLELILHNPQGTVLKTFRFPGNSQRRQIPMRGMMRGIYFLRTVENGQTHSTLRLQVD